MRCFVAEGAIAGRKRDAGEGTEQSRYEALARQSFDTAVQLGKRLEYTGNRINQDFGLAQTRELPKLIADDAHLQRVMATCQAIGL